MYIIRMYLYVYTRASVYKCVCYYSYVQKGHNYEGYIEVKSRTLHGTLRLRYVREGG